MRPLRLAVQAWLDWREPSGARTRLHGLLTALADLPESRDIEVHLLGSQDPDPVLEALCSRHAHFHWHGAFPRPGSSISRSLNENRLLTPILDKLEVDILDIASLPLPKVSLPICLTLHDLRDLGSHARGLRRFAIHQSLEFAVDQAVRILVPSSAVAHELAERHPRSARRISVVPPALDPRPFQSAKPLAELPHPYYLHLGRPEPRKNLPFLIRAYHGALANDPALPPLVLAGPDLSPDKLPRSLSRVLAQALAEGNSQVHLLDGVDDARLPSLLAGAIALLFPSTLEGFGMPALEALAAGVPILATNGSVQAEVAGSAGLELPLDQPEAWTRALLSLAHSPALHDRLSQAAHIRSLAFSPEVSARALLQAWHQVAGRG